MVDETDNKPREIPLRFRASLDPNDAKGFALLKLNDEKQAELAQHVNSPFAHKSPRDVFRAKALATIESLSNPVLVLSDDQKERLAECWGVVGRYDLASEISVANKALYEKYWQTIFGDNNETCDHPLQHVYTREIVYSVKHGKDVGIIACNVPGCDNWNRTSAE